MAAADPTPGAGLTVHLVRHGETVGYDADLGLTDVGRAQADATGRALAEQLSTAGLVHVLHAPTRRARETAEGLLRRLPHGSGPREEPGFGNITVALPDGAVELTAAPRTTPGEDPGAGPARELAWFWAAHERGDAMGFWLAQPLLHLETPVEVARRLWATAVRHAAVADPGQHVVVATHSGPMRALVATARGRDPGEPENGEVVRLWLGADHRTAAVAFRDRTDEVLLP